MLSLKELDIFLNLCKEPHVTKLARKLGISQSTISLSIKSLEKKLGEKLFDRIGKKLILNERGRIFKVFVEDAVLKLKDAENIFKQNRLSGYIKIGSSKSFSFFLLPKVICDFKNKYPNVYIEKFTDNTKNILEKVKEGDLDLGFVEDEIEDKEIIKEFLCKDELIVVSSNPKMKDKVFTIKELLNKKWVLREKGSGTRHIFENALGDLANKLNVFFICSNIEEIKQILKYDKETLSVVSKKVVEDEIKQGIFFPVHVEDLKIYRNLYLIYHKEKYISIILQKFLEFVRKFFKKDFYL